MTAAGQQSPADTHGYGGVAVTPDDDNDLDTPCRDIHVSVSGTLKITGRDGKVVEFPAVAGPGRVGVGAKRIWNTGTDATGIVALY